MNIHHRQRDQDLCCANPRERDPKRVPLGRHSLLAVGEARRRAVHTIINIEDVRGDTFFVGN